VFAGPHFPGAAHPGLDLVVKEQEAELVAQFTDPSQVPVAGDDVSRAGLAWFEEHGGHVRDVAPVLAKGGFLTEQHPPGELDAGFGAVGW
jgi:hypothetical protein